VHSLFGIQLEADLHLPGASPPRDAADHPVVRMARVSHAELEAAAPTGPPTWATRIEGRPFAVTVAGDGALAMSGGDGGRLRLDAAGGVLRWAVADPEAPAWQRLVLDTVAYLVALRLGREALHAGAVVAGGAALAVAAPSGGGKSTLLAALLGAGAELLADDILALEPETLLAHPGPPVMNVPADRPLAGAPVLDRFGDELWTSVPVAPGPVPLGGLVVLDRRADADTIRAVEDPSLPAILPRLLAFPRALERERRRFELAARIAQRVPVLRLSAPAEASPEALARHVLGLARPAPVAAA
jgi:hypothetical protein